MMKFSNRTSIVIYAVVIISVVLTIFYRWYFAAGGIGILGFFFGYSLYLRARVDLKVLGLILLEVLLISIGFSLAYYEISDNFIESQIISIQTLFHFTVITIVPPLAESITFKILASFEGLVGYVLVVSGVVMLIKRKNDSNYTH